jgi:hypothetical protein
LGANAETRTALKAHLTASEATRSAGETLTVPANASTSVTFTNVEKAAVLDMLEGWLDHAAGAGEAQGLLARDLTGD